MDMNGSKGYRLIMYAQLAHINKMITKHVYVRRSTHDVLCVVPLALTRVLHAPLSAAWIGGTVASMVPAQLYVRGQQANNGRYAMNVASCCKARALLALSPVHVLPQGWVAWVWSIRINHHLYKHTRHNLQSMTQICIHIC